MSAGRRGHSPMLRQPQWLSSISFPRRRLARPLFSICEFFSPPPHRSLDRREWRHLLTPDRRPEPRHFCAAPVLRSGCIPHFDPPSAARFHLTTFSLRLSAAVPRLLVPGPGSYI